MWSSYILAPHVSEVIISPIRHEHAQTDSPCELLTLVDLNGKQRTKGHVAFRDCLKAYAAYLNSDLYLHDWPQEELLQL